MSETANERFERLAAQFHKDTGMMAPGKDEPAGGEHHDYHVRLAAWNDWRNTPEDQGKVR